MIPDIAYFVTYSCPRCRMDLEAANRGWQGWLRCPGCGTPSLPPDILLGHPATRRRVMSGIEFGGTMVLDEEIPADDDIPAFRPTIAEPPSTAASALRMVLVGALALSLFILLVAYLDDNQSLTTLFGGLSFILFLLMLRSPARGQGRS